MQNIKYPNITVKIIGKNGNAFNILSICVAAMKKHKLPKSEIDKFMTEATSGNYDNLLCVVTCWFNIE